MDQTWWIWQGNRDYSMFSIKADQPELISLDDYSMSLGKIAVKWLYSFA